MLKWQWVRLACRIIPITYLGTCSASVLYSVQTGILVCHKKEMYSTVTRTDIGFIASVLAEETPIPVCQPQSNYFLRNGILSCIIRLDNLEVPPFSMPVDILFITVLTQLAIV